MDKIEDLDFLAEFLDEHSATTFDFKDIRFVSNNVFLVILNRDGDYQFMGMNRIISETLEFIEEWKREGQQN